MIFLVLFLLFFGWLHYRMLKSSYKGMEDLQYIFFWTNESITNKKIIAL